MVRNTLPNPSIHLPQFLINALRYADDCSCDRGPRSQEAGEVAGTDGDDGAAGDDDGAAGDDGGVDDDDDAAAEVGGGDGAAAAGGYGYASADA